MDAPNKIYVEVCEDGIFAFPEPPFKESVEYIRADLVGQSLQQEQSEFLITDDGSGAMGEIPPKFKLDVKPAVSKVNINKEIDDIWKSLNTGHDYVIVDSYQDFLGICMHCFELGLDAGKED